jgi:hypothetical protein
MKHSKDPKVHSNWYLRKGDYWIDINDCERPTNNAGKLASFNIRTYYRPRKRSKSRP